MVSFFSKNLFSVFVLLWLLLYIAASYLGDNYIEENYEEFRYRYWILIGLLFLMFLAIFLRFSKRIKEIVIAPVILAFLFSELLLSFYPSFSINSDDCKSMDGYFYLSDLPHGIGFGVSSKIKDVGYVYALNFSYSDKRVGYEFEKVHYRGFRCGTIILFENISQ